MYNSISAGKNYLSLFICSPRLLLLPFIMTLLGNSLPTTDNNSSSPVCWSKPVVFWATFATSIELSGTPPIQTARSTGVGTATHLGKTTFEGISTVNFSVQPVQLNGTATFTAANGDEIYTSFTGTTTNEAGMAKGNFVHVITGGTGRFSDANGLLRAISLHNLSTQAGTLKFEGEIDY